MAESGNTLPTISVDELRRHVEANNVFLLDLRRAVHGGQIYGAIRYDTHKLRDAPKLILPLPKEDGLIVLYDEDGNGKALNEIAAKLREDGYGELRALDGGFKAWQDADGKTEAETVEQPVPSVSGHQLER
ncbi:MAG: rhodanese-like domain-containing protein [Candidatus Eremiobacteraeota bacterium]|nr:rhodanese-like domain-containing protein [Candidatus Eremiobacteraeota bacterium]